MWFDPPKRRLLLPFLALSCGTWLLWACARFTSEPESPLVVAADATPDVTRAPPDMTRDAGANPKRIFMSNETYRGDLVASARLLGTYDGGEPLAAADSLCMRERPDTSSAWKAWLSAGDAGALARFQDKGPRVSTLGKPVLPALGSEPTSPIPGVDGKERIAVDGQGGDGSFVWTGALSDGSSAWFELRSEMVPKQRSDCRGWTVWEDNTIRGAAGSPNAPGVGWSSLKYGHFCGNRGHLYCLED
jgi:hypothetical protein